MVHDVDVLQENAVTVAIQPSLQMSEAERGWGCWGPGEPPTAIAAIAMEKHHVRPFSTADCQITGGYDVLINIYHEMDMVSLHVSRALSCHYVLCPFWVIHVLFLLLLLLLRASSPAPGASGIAGPQPPKITCPRECQKIIARLSA